MNRYAAQPDPEAPNPESGDAGPDGPKMWSQNLVVLYETDVDIAAMLPQPLEATDPIVRINLACVDMPMMDEPLQAGTFSVACRHGDIEGFYDLLMIMSTETAVTGGRETFGEPKKIGNVKLEHSGDIGTAGGSVVGVMTRKGHDLIEVRGTVAEVLDPGPVTERFANEAVEEIPAALRLDVTAPRLQIMALLRPGAIELRGVGVRRNRIIVCGRKLWREQKRRRRQPRRDERKCKRARTVEPQRRVT